MSLIRGNVHISSVADEARGDLQVAAGDGFVERSSNGKDMGADLLPFLERFFHGLGGFR